MKAVVDFETTGLPGEITQVAIVPFEDHTPFVYYSRPETIDRESRAWGITGIDPDWLLTALPAQDIVDRLIEWAPAQRLTPVAHNYPFEHSVLTSWLGNVKDQLFSHYGYCTFQMAALLREYGIIEPKNLKLGGLCEYFGIETGKLHDAYYDCLATKELFERLIHEYGISTLPAASHGANA